jgi:hypothetical protein
MRAADRDDPAGMTRDRQPVDDRRTDRAAGMRTFAFGARRLARHQQQHAVPAGDRAGQAGVEDRVRGGERVAVKIDRAVGADRAAQQPFVPAPV